MKEAVGKGLGEASVLVDVQPRHPRLHANCLGIKALVPKYPGEQVHSSGGVVIVI